MQNAAAWLILNIELHASTPLGIMHCKALFLVFGLKLTSILRTSEFC